MKIRDLKDKPRQRYLRQIDKSQGEIQLSDDNTKGNEETYIQKFLKVV